MTRPRKRDIKPIFLSFIDLLYYCRNQEIGKRGRTRIQLSELESKLISSQNLNEFLIRLSDDDVIQPPTSEYAYSMDENGQFVMEGGVTEIEVYCNKTKEEILEYRYSLTKTKNDLTVFRAPNWPSVSIKVRTTNDLLVTIQNTDVLDAPVTYGSLGFANSRNGKAIAAWEFFLTLAKHQGKILKNHNDLNKYNDNLDKYKQIVKEKLQNAFSLYDEDPFMEVKRRNGEYELKCTISIEAAAPQSETGSEMNFFDEEMEKYQ